MIEGSGHVRSADGRAVCDSNRGSIPLKKHKYINVCICGPRSRLEQALSAASRKLREFFSAAQRRQEYNGAVTSQGV